MSGWEDQNREMWARLVFALEQRSRPTVAWITCDSYRHLRKLVEEFKQRFAEARHFEHRVTDFKENSFPPYFRNHLPAEVYDGSEKRSFVHLFGLELHVGMGNAQPPSRLFEALNFEREVVFGDFPFTTVIWSDTSSQIKAQTLAPDFWDWITEKFHFEAPLDLIEGQLELMEAPKSLVPPEKRDELYHQIARHLQLLDRTERPVDRLNLLEVIADNYQALQDYDKAIHYREKILESGDPLSEEQRAYHLNQLGVAFHAVGQFGSALGAYQLSLCLWEQVGDRAGKGRVLNNIGQIYKEKGEYATALEYLEQCLKIQEEIGDRAGVGATLNNISQISFAQGDYIKALHYLEVSLKIRQEIGDSRGEATTLNNLTAFSFAQGDYVTSMRYLDRSLKIQQDIGDRAGEGVTLNNIGQIYHALGEYGKALDYFGRSLKIQQEIGDRAGEGTTLNNISQVYVAQGDCATALNILERSVDILHEIGDRKGECAALNNLAGAVHALGDSVTALGFLKRSLHIQQEIGDVFGEGVTLHNIGAICVEREEYSRAIQAFERSFIILNQIGSPDAKKPESQLNAIREKIGEAKFRTLVEELKKQEENGTPEDKVSEGKD